MDWLKDILYTDSGPVLYAIIVGVVVAVFTKLLDYIIGSRRFRKRALWITVLLGGGIMAFTSWDQITHVLQRIVSYKASVVVTFIAFIVAQVLFTIGMLIWNKGFRQFITDSANAAEERDKPAPPSVDLTQYKMLDGHNATKESFNWHVTTDLRNPQRTALYPVDLMGCPFIGITCHVSFTVKAARHFSFGIKLKEHHTKDFAIGSNLVEGDDVRLALHVRDRSCFATMHIGTKQVAEDQWQSLGHIPLDDQLVTFKFQVVCRDLEHPVLLINDRVAFTKPIKMECCSKLVMMVWGDEEEYTVDIQNILVLINRNLRNFAEEVRKLRQPKLPAHG